MLDVIIKRFDQPDETRSFPKGKFDLVRIGGMAIGRATYQPGWKWSVDVGRPAGLRYCRIEHVGIVVAGRAVAALPPGAGGRRAERESRSAYNFPRTWSVALSTEFRLYVNYGLIQESYPD
jgi:hypothetical protein